jgi:hypothetical protein
VLGDNCSFIDKRESLRKWFKRTKVTIYFRKRARKMAISWNKKQMKICWEAMMTQNLKDKKFMRKMF